MYSHLHCNGTLRIFEVTYLPTFRENLDRSSRNVDKYQSTVRNNPEEQRPHLHRGGSLNSSEGHVTFLAKYVTDTVDV